MQIKINTMFNYCILTVIMMTVPQTLNATNYGPNHPKDFKNAIDLAKRWGEQTFKNWQHNKLTTEEKNGLQRYTTNSFRTINPYLRETKGQINYEENDSWEAAEKASLFKQIKTIDRALAKIKLPEALVTYRRLDERHFSMERYTLRQELGAINSQFFHQIKSAFLDKEFIKYDFTSTSLINNYEHKTFSNERFPILMTVTIPQDTHAGYLGAGISRYPSEFEMLVMRGYSFKYNRFSIIKEGTKETLKVEVSLVK